MFIFIVVVVFMLFGFFRFYNIKVMVINVLIENYVVIICLLKKIYYICIFYIYVEYDYII